jgi:hypothetical protein
MRGVHAPRERVQQWEEEGDEWTARAGLPEASSPVLGETDPEADGALCCGDAAPAAGEATPDRREGTGVTVIHPPRLGEEDHNPCSPPPGMRRMLRHSARRRSGCTTERRELVMGENEGKLTVCLPPIHLWADPRG